MRYAPEHKARTRERVLGAAVRAMKLGGLDSVGVASVMAEAGLTHGGFYSHFRSRDALIAATLDHALQEVKSRYLDVTRGKAPAQALADYIDFYLSEQHRDAVVEGCVVAALSADAWRMSPAARETYARAHALLAQALAGLIDPAVTDDRPGLGLSMTAEMVGALTLARATPDRSASRQLLAACRTSLKSRAGVAHAKSSERLQ